MNQQDINCIACHHLGYYYTEIRSGGMSVYTIPEVLPALCREALTNGTYGQYAASIGALASRSTGITCLAERTNEAGYRVHAHTEFVQTASDEDGLRSLRHAVLSARQCRDFALFNQHLSYEGYFELIKHKEHEAALERFQAEQRQQGLLILRAQLEDMQASHRTPQERGKEFERWMVALLDLYGMSPTLDVRNEVEQVDFSFWYGATLFIGEARWHSSPVSCSQVRDFWGKLLDRPPIVAGLLISISGLTKPASDWIRKHSGERTVLAMNPGDIASILSANPELPVWLWTSIRSRLEHP